MATAVQLEPPEPPSDTFRRARWVPTYRVEWAEQCDRIMRSHGAVYGSNVYPARHLARWRAKYLIKLMVELGLHERWELVEHTEHRGTGWVWSVEYVGRGGPIAAR